MEDIVASVFHSFDCKVEISKKSHDGGIDVFGIDQVGMPFGIQVKRHRNKVRIDEIRSFLGALLLHGIANGVFVTTSTFTGGASRLQQQAGVGHPFGLYGFRAPLGDDQGRTNQGLQFGRCAANCRKLCPSNPLTAFWILLASWQSLRSDAGAGGAECFQPGCCCVMQWIPPPPAAMASMFNWMTSRPGNKSRRVSRVLLSAVRSPNSGAMMAPLQT